MRNYTGRIKEENDEDERREERYAEIGLGERNGVIVVADNAIIELFRTHNELSIAARERKDLLPTSHVVGVDAVLAHEVLRPLTDFVAKT